MTVSTRTAGKAGQTRNVAAGFLLLLCFFFCGTLFAQKMFLYPKVAIAPRGTYQSVTAIVTGVNNKSVTWTASGGKLVGTNPCVANEPCTISLFSSEPGKYTVKATSNAEPSRSVVSEVTFTASPRPATAHPRLVITAAMLPGLRAKADAKNPMYESLQERATEALDRDSKVWAWTCKGGTGLPSTDESQSFREQDAYLFALMSEIAPTAEERTRWGCFGRDVFLTMAGYVLKGSLDLSKGNHWSDSAVQLAMTPDWLMGSGSLSASDLVITRRYFAKLAFEQINDVYNGTLAVIGKYHTAAQFDEASEWSTTGMRAMGNNYSQSRILILTAAALTFDDTPNDDPPLTNSCGATRYQICPDGTAGSLHAYWSYVSGGMLYKDWANMEDASVVQQAYHAAYQNLPVQPLCNTPWHKRVPCLGGGRGGESSEGTSYGGSLGRLRWALNAIHTAGYDDPLLYGPQMSIGSMSYWDLRYVSDMTLLTGLSGIPSEQSRWAFLTDGDTLYYFDYPSNHGVEAALLTFDSYTARTDRSAALKWVVMNTAFGLASGRVGACNSYCGLDNELSNDYGSTVALDLFLALPGSDPVTTNVPADPRPSLPTDWYDAGNQHLVARSGWGTNTNTIFSYYCTNTQIDHEHQYCGGFSVYANGEYITKGRTEFNDYNDEFSVARNQNSTALMQFPGQTWCTPNPWCSFNQAADDGGQFWHGYQAGLVTLYHSELPEYVAAISEATNAYNGGWGSYSKFGSITGASRSLIYLRDSNQVIYYDRGSSGANAWDKATYMVTTGPPSFNGSSAGWLTRSKKQRVYWTALAPVRSSPRLDAVYNDEDRTNDWEIYGRVKADAGSVRSAHMLSVLQWGPGDFPGARSALVESLTGTPFEGAHIGSSLVMFMRDWPSNLTSVTFPAYGATSEYISDLKPNTTYAIAGEGAPPQATTDEAGVLAIHVAGAGNVTISAPRQERVNRSR